MKDLENPWDLGREAGRPDEEEEEEEEWEEEEEEDDEDWEEEEEEEEEEEDEGKVTKAASEKMEDKAEKKAEEPKKEEKAAKKDDKGKKEKDDKKKEKPAKEDKPAGPSDPLKTAKILFVAGICMFFLSTCAFKSHGHSLLKYKGLATFYQGGTKTPIAPPKPYHKNSVKIDRKERADEQETFDKEFDEALEKYSESAEFKEFLKEKEALNAWIHEQQPDLASANRSMAKIEAGRGNWAPTRFRVAHLGILLMTLGLILYVFNGDKYEKIAALLVLGVGVLPLLSGGLGHWMSIGSF